MAIPRLIAAAALLLFTLCCVTTGPVPDGGLGERVERWVSVTSTTGAHDTFCSGVILETGLVLTAAHCWGEKVEVGGKEALVLKRAVESDLMLLQAITDEFLPIELYLNVPAGLSVFFVRPIYPINTVSVGFGKVTGWIDGDIMVNEQSWPGTSGTGFWAYDGRLVGILSASFNGIILTKGVSAKKIKAFLEGVTNPPKTPEESTDF